MMQAVAEEFFRPRGLTARFQVYLAQQNRSLESATPMDARAWVSSLARTTRNGVCVYTCSTMRGYVHRLRAALPCFDASVSEHVEDLARLRQWRPPKFPDPPMPLPLLRSVVGRLIDADERDMFAKVLLAIVGATGVVPFAVMKLRDSDVELRDDAVVFVFRRSRKVWSVEVLRSIHEEVDVVRVVSLWRTRMKLDGSTDAPFFVGNLKDGVNRTYRIKQPGNAALGCLYRALRKSRERGQWTWASIRRGHALKLLAAGLPGEMIWRRMGFGNEQCFDHLLRATNRPDVIDVPV